MSELRILFVDPSEPRSRELVRNLRSDGYEVVTTSARSHDLMQALREHGPDMVLVNAKQLQDLEEQRTRAVRSSEERAQVEKAKDILMSRSGLTEDAAHRALRRMAMSRNMRLVDVARSVLAQEAKA